MGSGNSEAREAQHGQKMIELKVRFWTDEIAEEPGKIIPKHGWTGGVVRLKTNKAHGVADVDPIPFNSLLDLPAAIERLLIREGIVLHATDRTAKYTSSNSGK